MPRVYGFRGRGGIMSEKDYAELKAENDRLKQTLQEIKKIAEVGQDKYHNGLIIAKPIIDLITKAESEG